MIEFLCVCAVLICAFLLIIILLFFTLLDHLRYHNDVIDDIFLYIKEERL